MTILRSWWHILLSVGERQMDNKSDKKILYTELKALIEGESRKELECRKYLEYLKGAFEILAKGTYIKVIQFKTEYSGNSGIPDYILSVYKEEVNVKCNRAYIWEVKAPQCSIFVKETKNRLRPSDDLVKAENQLLHYYNEHKNSSSFHSDFEITHPDYICFGGIIIGCERTKVTGKFESESDKKKLYEKALRIRKEYFYKQNEIKIILWDSILDQLSYEKHENKKEISTEPLQEKSLTDNVGISESVEVIKSS